MSYKVKEMSNHRGYMRTTRPPITKVRKPVTAMRRLVVKTATSSAHTPCGNVSQWKEFSGWLTSNEKFKCLLLIGPTGCGKTHMTYAKATEHDRQIYEINAGNIVGEEQLKEDLYQACTCTSDTLSNAVDGDTSHKKLVLLEDVDGYSTSAVNTIYSFLQSRNRPSACEPIVCTCTPHNSYATVKLLRGVCNKVIWLNPIDEHSLEEYAKRHFPNKMQETTKGAIKRCRGDLRQLIMYLSYATGTCTDDSKRGLWDTVAATLRQDSNCRHLCNYHEPEVIFNMLFENYAKFHMSDEKLMATANAFSIIDTMRSGNINSLKREAWELAYQLPTKINIPTNTITYMSFPRPKIKFVNFENEFRVSSSNER